MGRIIRSRPPEPGSQPEDFFRRAFHEAPVGLAITSAAADDRGRLLDVNTALCELLGYDRELLLAMTLDALTHPADRDRSAEVTAQLLAGVIDHHHGETRFIDVRGETIEASVGISLIRDADGAPLQFITQLADVTAHKSYERQLQHMANHDPLTGLFNRTRFDEALNEHLARVRRHGESGAVLMIDLDHFKDVNDQLGHSAGDLALMSVARVLQARVRDTDVLARLGGDEFAVLMTEGGAIEAQVLAGDISDLIRRRCAATDGGGAGDITASIGIAVFDADGASSPSDVVAEADAAMYTAKRAGRDRIAAAADRHDDGHATRMTIHQQIDAAMADDRFALHLQPVLDMRTDRIWGQEALLRMVGADGTLMPPATFLYVAERFGQIHAIDRWVVDHAIALLPLLPAAQSLEVNISARGLSDLTLADHIPAELLRAGADPRRLIFEITETAAIQNIQAARAFAERLTALGCRFALDDFGAGFGSFYYLKYLPFDYLKIDGEFVRNCAASRTDQLVIQACVQMARGLGKQTVAEFVENAETRELVEALGVDHAQGHWIGRPQAVGDGVAGAASRGGTDRLAG